MATKKQRAAARRNIKKARAALMRKGMRLPAKERATRAGRARRVLLPAGIKAAGKRGFYGTLEKLEKYVNHIKTPERLAGWLKKRAQERGVLSPLHPYVGRRKRRT